MKKLQCAKCRQIFWSELPVDEALVGPGEWIERTCPNCGGEWAITEPAAKTAGTAKGRRGRPAKGRRGRPKSTPSPVGEEPAALRPAGIRRLRKKLGISQKELGLLMGASTGSIVSWEKGKFKPRKEKIAQLEALMGMGKEDAAKLIAEKTVKKPEERKEKESAPKKATKKRSARKKAPAEEPNT